jgi:hypothetical protein
MHGSAISSAILFAAPLKRQKWLKLREDCQCGSQVTAQSASWACKTNGSGGILVLFKFLDFQAVKSRLFHPFAFQARVMNTKTITDGTFDARRKIICILIQNQSNKT